ncbi:MULE domain-containing protein [Trichonephila clavata]|uniref:MULE domain-containing protein n=1 Tax=Trichonephila clavata TaxID=2740835 RepID=A0A8X6H958_TRICU|nr:MULE domain-containing protein [Trichonephila clavata]
MKVYEDIESKVTVEFTKNQVGHGINLGLVKITREEKDIARKLENKIPIETILDDIRNSVNEKLERIHLITRQDIKIIKEYNISSDGILDTNDVVSVTKWVEGLKNREDSPIVLFKDQNIFDEDLYPGMKAEDFLLVIMNASQKDMLKFYGNDTICLDFTHGMNAYGFDLATSLVLDDKTEGFPAAFILSNRQDSTALKLAFAAIKEHTCIVLHKF